MARRDEARAFSSLPARVADLERRLVVLEQQHTQRRGPRDPADVALLAMIALKIGSARWTCQELLQHAGTDPDLQQALTAADITTTVELGQLLGRCAGHAIDGRIVRRARLARGRARWWVEMVEI